MSITVNLIKRSEQSSPLSASEYDANLSAIQAAFASIPSTGGGSVTSVGLSTTQTTILTIASTPVVSSGVITINFASQVANTVFSGPSSGANAAPTFRSLVANDLPTVPISKLGTTTASRVVVTSGAGVIEASSTIDTTELSYLDGVTSNIQTQLNAKQATIGVLGIANGGTSGSTAQTARLALLPSITGNAGKYLRVNSTPNDVEWVTVAGAIASVNSLTGALTITSGTTGTDVAVASAGSTITVNIPSASATARGVITTAAQTIAGIKTFSAAPIVPITDTYIMYSNSGEVSGSAAFVVDAAKEQMQVKRSIITERQVALGFNDTYHTTNQTVAPERDYILYFDTSGGSLDCTMFDTTNPSAEIGSLYKIVKTTAANNLVIKVQGSDSIGTLATTTYTLTGVKGWVEVQFVKSGLFSILSTGTIS